MPIATQAPSGPAACEITRRGIDRFIPFSDVVERHDTLIDAPADLVMDVAMNLDIMAIPAVRFIFWAREKLLRSTPAPPTPHRSLAAMTRSIGWSVLALRPGREYVSGAAAQPWKADVVFHPVSPADFFDYTEPDQVKIAWTLEAIPEGPARTRFVTETRVVATDDGAREKFRRYWRFFGVGIVAIRWLLVPAVRRRAERRYAETQVRHDHGAVIL